MSVDPNLLKGNLDLILLTILEPGERYGLEIIQEAQARTEGYFDFKEGSLYPALHRLERAGLLESEVHASELGGSRRKYYRLTERGRAELITKRQAWERFNAAVSALSGAR